MNEAIFEGLTLAFVGIMVVFSALLFLWFSLSLISGAINANIKSKLAKEGKDVEKTIGMSGEVAAAISFALHMYLEDTHDQEEAILTIKRLSKTYSPWSSKIYSVMGLNKRPLPR